MKVKYLILLIILVAACKTDYTKPETAMLMEIPDDEILEDMVVFAENADYSIHVPTTMQTPIFKESDRKFIKNGSLEFETESLDKTIAQIKRETQKVGGYVGGESEFELDFKIKNTLRIRVPTEQFDSFINSISQGVERFDRKEISINEITEEYLDLKTRIENKKKLENRYLEILKKADSVKDILSVERETGKIREEIESMQGRLNYLENRSSFSTLVIITYQLIPSHNLKQNNFISQLKVGLSNGIGIIKSLILGLVNIWPLLIFGVAGFVFFKYRIRTKKALEAS